MWQVCFCPHVDLDFCGPSLRPASMVHARPFLAPIAVGVNRGSLGVLKTSESFGYDCVRAWRSAESFGYDCVRARAMDS